MIGLSKSAANLLQSYRVLAVNILCALVVWLSFLVRDLKTLIYYVLQVSLADSPNASVRPTYSAHMNIIHHAREVQFASR